MAVLVWLNSLRRFQAGTFVEKQAKGWTSMLLTHRRLKVGRGQIFRVWLMRTPLHEQAVTDAAQQASDEHGWGAANAAAVIVMRSVQALVQTIFDAAKAGPVEFQPASCVEFGWWSAGQEGDLFRLVSFVLAQQSGCLGHQRKANLLRRDFLSENRAADHIALVVMQSAKLVGRGLPRGENPPWGRAGVFQCFGEPSADYLWP